MNNDKEEQRKGIGKNLPIFRENVSDRKRGDPFDKGGN